MTKKQCFQLLGEFTKWLTLLGELARPLKVCSVTGIRPALNHAAIALCFWEFRPTRKIHTADADCVCRVAAVAVVKSQVLEIYVVVLR